MCGFRKCCDCRESRVLCDLPKALTDKTRACGWARFTRKLCAERASWTGENFACACVRLLNDNSVDVSNLMAGNRKPSFKLHSSWKPSRWCFKFFCFATKNILHHKNRMFFTQVFSCRIFAVYRLCWPFKDFIDLTPKNTVSVYFWFSLVKRCISKEELYPSNVLQLL